MQRKRYHYKVYKSKEPPPEGEAIIQNKENTMKTQPLKGMRDLLPREQALRDYIQGQILATYRAAGFQRISTPILEDMENLDKSDGGDNLNLIPFLNM